LNHGFHGFHGSEILHPRHFLKTNSTEANEGNEVPIPNRDRFLCSLLSKRTPYHYRKKSRISDKILLTVVFSSFPSFPSVQNPVGCGFAPLAWNTRKTSPKPIFIVTRLNLP